MIKITGIEEIQKTLADAQKALSDIDGILGTISFDPHSPESIEMAISHVERLIDNRVYVYKNNNLVRDIIIGLKEKYRDIIIEKASIERMRSDCNG